MRTRSRGLAPTVPDTAAPVVPTAMKRIAVLGAAQAVAWAGLAFVALLVAATSARAQVRLTDDFEGTLAQWVLTGEGGAFLHDSGDPGHGRVLVLRPQGDVTLLASGSETWGGVRIEGDVLFPSDEHSYFGVIYNYQRHGERQDFGLIYIKGNGSYIRVNPHRDFNVGRTLYEDFRTALGGNAAITIGRWQRFRVEVIGPECHFYVGDAPHPQVTFSDLELDRGAVGMHPRSVGADVWVDNVVITSIAAFTYDGAPRPGHAYEPEQLVTDWEVAGPFAGSRDDLARRPGDFADAWRPFTTDRRGAVITGRVVDTHGPRKEAYFRTQVDAQSAGDAILHLSSVDDMALWINGRFWWFIPRGRLAWYDFWKNPDHEGQRIPIPLHQGSNDIVIRVRGGVYASGGFFARIEPDED